MESLTSETSRTWPLRTWGLSSSATSSPASADGPSPSDWQTGETDLFGRVVVPASPSLVPGSKREAVTIDISGRIGRGSLESATLQRLLVSRLRARLPTAGSTLFSMTWSQKATPAGRLISRLRASAPRTDDNGYGSWPTTTVQDAIGSRRHGYMDDGRPRAAVRQQKESLTGHSGTTLTDAATLASWATPRTPSGGAESATRKQELGRTESGGGDLQAQALLASWATPTTRDHKDGDYCENVPENALLGRQVWQTDRGIWESDGTIVRQTSWASPQARDYRSVTGREPEQRDNAFQNLNVQAVLLPSGPTAPGSPAATASGGQLNPAHSRWLMGYPPAWDACAATVTLLRPKSRRKS